MADGLEPDEDHAAFEVERDRLVAAFSRAGGAGFEQVAERILDFKWSHLGGDLDEWSVEEVEEVLFDLYPAKVLLDAADIPEVPAGFAALLRFLAGDAPEDQRWLGTLADAVERSAAKFVAAMNDESNWSFGKRLWSTALAEGIDLDDEQAVQRFMADFNQRSRAERDRILGRGLAAAPTRPILDPFPPVVLAAEEELRAAAISTVLARRLTALVEYVGAGRAVTDTGNLELAAGKELVALLGTDDRFDEQVGDEGFEPASSEELTDVDWTYRVALDAGLLRIDGRTVARGPSAALVDSPLDLVEVLLSAILHVGPTWYRYRQDPSGFGRYAGDLDLQLLGLLLALYRDRQPREIDLLAETMWDVLESERDLSDMPADELAAHRRFVDAALLHVLGRIGELGIVDVAGEALSPAGRGGVERGGGTAALSPLGLWALQRVAAKLTEAPIVGTLRDVAAGELLRAAGDLADDLAAAELDAWVDHHGERAAAELCAALPAADETGRGLALRALLRIGPAAADAVAELRGDPDLADVVTVFRVETRTGGPDEPDRAGDPAAWVRLLHTVVALRGPDVAAEWAIPAAGAPGIEAMLAAAWRVKGPPTAEVLGAVGTHHPDKHVAKAARKALFKHRSAC